MVRHQRGAASGIPGGVTSIAIDDDPPRTPSGALPHNPTVVAPRRRCATAHRGRGTRQWGVGACSAACLRSGHDHVAGDTRLEFTSILRPANMLLAVAFASGLVLAFIRFGTDRESPPWIAKLHGFAAAAALTLLVAGWAQAPATHGATFAVATLLVAAAAGLLLNLGYHWRHKALPEGLVFAHMSVAFIGFLVALILMISRPA
jgi:hypothetical protein